MDVKKVLAKNIRTLRERRGLKRHELANMAQMSVAGLVSIEGGIRWPRPENLEALAQQLGVPIGILFSENAIPEAVPVSDEQVLKLICERFGFETPKLKKIKTVN